MAWSLGVNGCSAGEGLGRPHLQEKGEITRFCLCFLNFSGLGPFGLKDGMREADASLQPERGDMAGVGAQALAGTHF